MITEDILVFVVPAVAFALTVAAGYFSGKARSLAASVMLGLVWTGFTVAMFFGMENASGWDGLGYLLGLLFISAPTGLGLSIGSLVGWLKNGTMKHA